MELTESLESINRQLRDLFGFDIITGESIWRVVFSEDQFEKRLMTHTDAGVILLKPEVREVPKYRQYIQQKFLLERLTLVPDMNQRELAGNKISYEPIFVFEHAKTKVALPARLDAAKFVIDSLYAAMGRTSLAKYKEDGLSQEEQDIKVKKLQEELFGNETDVGDALAHGSGVSVPHVYKKGVH